MPGSRAASGTPSDRPGPEEPESEEHRGLPLDFDLNAFLGTQVQSNIVEVSEGSSWRQKLSGSGIPRSTGDIVFSIIIGLLKKTITAALLTLLVIFLVFGPNAPWDQLKWNILRGGADDDSLAQCEEIGEWFSLFDQHIDRIDRLIEEAGPPDSWDETTLARVADLMPQYMNDWLVDMQQNDPPPAGQQMNDLYISFLENFGNYVLALQDGDLEAQQYFERENSIILAGLDIETRYITNLCI